MDAGIYLHIPFCKSRCSYCDFATDIYRDASMVDRYVAALCKEISKSSHDESSGDLRVDTIYFGGGTPSLLNPVQVEKVLDAVRSRFDVISGPEITMEMNPATVSIETLRAYRSLGVNRASFGVQTFNDRHLKLLARGHDAKDARETFRMLRKAGFENISFDLIAGLPGQSLKDWERNLDEAITMRPEHISLYLLEIHEGTPLAEQVRSHRRPVPDEEIAAEMYEVMLDRLDAAGYSQYEISNFSLAGQESRHNSKYWRLDPVLGFGVSAHSFDGNERFANVRETGEYVNRIDAGDTVEVMRELTDRASEYVFLGLRMEDGIDLVEYRTRFGDELMDRYGEEIDRLSDIGLIDNDGDRLRLTRRGKLFSNEVFAVFV